MLPNLLKDTYGLMEETWEDTGIKAHRLEYFVPGFGLKLV